MRIRPPATTTAPASTASTAYPAYCTAGGWVARFDSTVIVCEKTNSPARPAAASRKATASGWANTPAQRNTAGSDAISSSASASSRAAVAWASAAIAWRSASDSGAISRAVCGGRPRSVSPGRNSGSGSGGSGGSDGSDSHSAVEVLFARRPPGRGMPRSSPSVGSVAGRMASPRGVPAGLRRPAGVSSMTGSIAPANRCERGSRMPDPTAPPGRPMTAALAVAAAAFAAGVRLVPYDYRVLNFVPLGAVALFAAARLGLRTSLLLAIGVQVVTDLGVWAQHDRSELYTPWFLAPLHGWSQTTVWSMAAGTVVYAALVGYAVLGRRFLAGTESPVAVGLTALSGSVLFFVVTNFVSWLVQMTPYGYTPEGLANCFRAGLEFYRGTLPADLIYTGFLFGAHAVLARAAFPAERVVPATAEVRA